MRLSSLEMEHDCALSSHTVFSESGSRTKAGMSKLFNNSELLSHICFTAGSTDVF